MNQKKINKQFTALKKVRAEIAATGELYELHNRLMDSLLPLFVEKTDDGFVFKHEIKVGTNKHRFAPEPSDVYIHFKGVSEWLKSNHKENGLKYRG